MARICSVDRDVPDRCRKTVAANGIPALQELGAHRRAGRHFYPIDAPDGVLPLALNMELPGGYVSEAVPTYAAPLRNRDVLLTADSFQLAAGFHILAGNRPLACDNIPRAASVRNIKWSGAGVPQIELRFDIDKQAC